MFWACSDMTMFMKEKKKREKFLVAIALIYISQQIDTFLFPILLRGNLTLPKKVTNPTSSQPTTPSGNIHGPVTLPLS